MPQLIAVIIILVLYYFLIKWLFTAIVPDLLLLSVLLGVAAIPITYARAVFRVFRARNALGYVALGVVCIILALIYADVGFITVMAIQGMVRTHSGPDLREFLGAVAAQWPGNREIIYFWAQLFAVEPRANVVALILLSSFTKGLLLAPLLLLARGLSNSVPGRDQPARVQYFFAQAYKDLERVVIECMRDMTKVIKAAFAGIGAVTLGPQGIFIWPLSVTAWGALLPVTCAAVLVLLMLVAIHGLSALLVAMLNMYLAIMLHLLERVIMLIRSGYAKCPHATCHQPVPLPMFSCPQCGIRHTRLVPGRYGVLFRKCQCERASLPTLYILGKGRLRSHCPSCEKPLRKDLFIGNIHLPIYGGTSAGKTMFMMGSVWQLLEKRLSGVDAALIKESDQSGYQTTWKSQFEGGILQSKTTQALPDAFLLSLARGAGLPLSLYMYDPDGQALAQDTQLQGHRFLRYLDGIALIIDPLSMPAMADRYQEDCGGALPAGTSHMVPTEILPRIVTALEHQKILARGKPFRRPVAVILSKADIPIVQKELGLTLSAEQPGARWNDLGRAESAKIRGWIERHDRRLLQLLEARFTNLRFFAVSSLGHAPAPGTGFSPRHILHPLCWLLSTRYTLRHPLLARVGSFATELVAMAVILGLFVATPAFGLNAIYKSWRRKEALARAEKEPVFERIKEQERANAAPSHVAEKPPPLCTSTLRIGDIALPPLPISEPLLAALCKLGSTDLSQLWGSSIETAEARLSGFQRAPLEDARRFLPELVGELRGAAAAASGKQRRGAAPTAAVRLGFLDGHFFRLQIHTRHRDRAIAAQLQGAFGHAAQERGKNEEGVPYLAWHEKGVIVQILSPPHGQDLVLVQASQHDAATSRLAKVAAAKKLVLQALTAARARPAELDNALELNQKALAMVPEYADAAVNLCGVYYDQGNATEAAAACQSAEASTQEASVRGEAKFYRGLIATQAGKNDEAATLFAQAETELPSASRMLPGLKLRRLALSGNREAEVTRAALYDHLCYSARKADKRSAAIPKEYGFDTADALRQRVAELGIDTEAVDAEVTSQCAAP